VDINNDQLRRELRDADDMNREAVPRFAEALKRIFDPRSRYDSATKAEVLGLPAPGRRTFLKIGGMTVLGGAVLAACGSDSKKTTSSTTAASTSTSTGSGRANLDATLAKTAASLEALAVAAYGVAISSGLVTTPGVGDAAKLFQDHHMLLLDAIY
jgi:hypothetical protein